MNHTIHKTPAGGQYFIATIIVTGNRQLSWLNIIIKYQTNRKFYQRNIIIDETSVVIVLVYQYMLGCYCNPYLAIFTNITNIQSAQINVHRLTTKKNYTTFIQLIIN